MVDLGVSGATMLEKSGKSLKDASEEGGAFKPRDGTIRPLFIEFFLGKD